MKPTIPGEGYFASLDGLRGVSILAIVIVHALLPDIRASGAGAAFIAVNTFFVLSGFLITSLLIAEWDQYGRISLRSFYARRALRLLPALAAVLVTFTLWNYFFRTSASGVATLQDALFPACYISNWSRALGYGRPVLFAHTWSLSIEEQFYLLLPLSLVFLLKRTSGASLVRCLILALFMIVVVRVLLVAGGATPERIFNGTDTRADSLLVGCLVAAVLASGLYKQTPARGTMVRYGAWASLLFLIGMSSGRNFNRPFAEYVLFFLCSVSAGLIILEVVTSRGGLLSGILSQRVLVYIGKVSYGLYLWHAPIFQEVFGQGWSRPTELAIGFAFAAFATLTSYYLLERPILEVKTRFARVRSTEVWKKPGLVASVDSGLSTCR